MSEAIQFPAEIIKVQTMVDGAIRLTLDLPAGELGAAIKLMEAKQRGAVIEVAAVAVKVINDDGTDESAKIHI